MTIPLPHARLRCLPATLLLALAGTSLPLRAAEPVRSFQPPVQLAPERVGYHVNFHLRSVAATADGDFLAQWTISSPVNGYDGPTYSAFRRAGGGTTWSQATSPVEMVWVPNPGLFPTGFARNAPLAWAGFSINQQASRSRFDIGTATWSPLETTTYPSWPYKTYAVVNASGMLVSLWAPAAANTEPWGEPDYGGYALWGRCRATDGRWSGAVALGSQRRSADDGYTMLLQRALNNGSVLVAWKVNATGGVIVRSAVWSPNCLRQGFRALPDSPVLPAVDRLISSGSGAMLALQVNRDGTGLKAVGYSPTQGWLLPAAVIQTAPIAAFWDGAIKDTGKWLLAWKNTGSADQAGQWAFGALSTGMTRRGDLPSRDARVQLGLANRYDQGLLVWQDSLQPSQVKAVSYRPLAGGMSAPTVVSSGSTGAYDADGTGYALEISMAMAESGAAAIVWNRWTAIARGENAGTYASSPWSVIWE